MEKNKKLNKAKAEKNDEFYTKLTDIEIELRHYGPEIEKLEKELNRKVRIGCNCDDEKGSAFYTYFSQQDDYHPNYEAKYTGYELIPDNTFGYTKKELDKVGIKKNKNGDVETLNYMYVDKDGYAKGDFRAKEQELLGEWADIIITNPPFSLFREFMNYIFKYNKKFLIVGGLIALTYKEITKLVVEKKLGLGINHMSDFLFADGTSYKKSTGGSKLPSTTMGYTNLKSPIENRKLFLSHSYKKEPELYKMADNMPVLNINKVKEIPYDYDDVMAVPISFFTKYNPEQFEILCDSRYYHKGGEKAFDMIVDGKRTFRKLIIKNKQVDREEY